MKVGSVINTFYTDFQNVVKSEITASETINQMAHLLWQTVEYGDMMLTNNQ